MRFFILIWCLCAAVCQGQQRKIGDVIRNSDGSRGVVFWVAPDGTSGWMVALYDLPAKKAWGNVVNVPALPDLGTSGYIVVKRALSDTSGYENTAKLRAFQGPGTKYAAQCVDFDQGWYLPAAAQVRKLYAVMNDINPVLIAAGGSALKTTGSVLGDYVYSSSSEANASNNWACSFSDGQIGIVEKSELLITRQIRTFVAQEVEYDTTLNYHWNTGASTPFIRDYPEQTMQYKVSVSSSVGCTNFATRKVFVSSTDPIITYDTICPGEVYRENGFEASVSGTYEQVLQNVEGCDLHLTLKLTVLDPIETVIYDTICEGDIYTKNNFAEWEPGEYRQVWNSTSGCDSLVRLHLTVHPVYQTVFYDTICEGEQYSGHGFRETVAGLHKQHLQSRLGCDSLVQLYLTVHPVYQTVFYDTICEGESYDRHGFSESETGIYEHRYKGTRDCDSVVILNLTVNSVYQTILYDTICEGERYDQYGFSETLSGSYEQSLQSRAGCDSLVRLHLTVNPVSQTVFYDTICEGEQYNKHGFRENTTGLYEQHLQSRLGCDSLVQLHLTVEPAYYKIYRDSICEGEQYTLHGFSESATGIYEHRYPLTGNCDSVVVLDLTVHPVYDIVLYDTICEGEQYNRYGFSETVAGDYELQLKSRAGCDSLVSLHLVVLPVWQTEIYDTICEGEIYQQHGFSEQTSGVYEQQLFSSGGCDSLVRLFLTVNPSYERVIRDTVCYNDAYERYGFSIPAVQTSGEYAPMHYTTVNGCDSVVRLILTVHPVYDYWISDTVCEGEDYIKNGFHLTGLHTSGDYPEQVLTSRYGCDSLVRLHLTVFPVFDTLLLDTVCAGQHYKKYGFEYEAVTIGQQCEPLHLQSSRGCDSLVRLQLEVPPVYFFSDSRTICEGEQSEFRGRLLEEAGIYVDSLKTRMGCDSIYQLQLSVNPVFRDTLKAVVCEGQRYQENGFDEGVEGFYEKHYETIYGCDSAVYLNLKVNSYFKGGILSTLEDCTTHTYRFETDWKEAEAEKEGYRFWWDFGDGETDEGEDMLHQYADSGSYQIHLQVVTPGNCSGEAQILQKVAYYSPELKIYARPESVDSDHPQIHLWTDSLPGMSYDWELGDGHRAIGVSVFHIYSFDRTGTYEVKLTRMNAEDCPVESTLLVHAYHLISPPNTFSPNGDGINDFFMKGYRVRIINRNGVEIFKGEDGWDGTQNGQLVPEDTYFYELYYPTSLGEKQTMGYITVVW